MKKFGTCLGAALLLSSAALATEDATCITDISKVDTDRYCVFDNKPYSVGAVIQSGEKLLECSFERGVYEGAKAGARWIKAK